MNSEDEERHLPMRERDSRQGCPGEPEASGHAPDGIGRALFGNEELYGAVVESIADGIAITVKTERVFVNRAFLAIHGLRDASEVVGHPLDQFVLPEDREAVRQRALARQRGESVENLVEYRVKRPDGEIKTVQASVVATTYRGQPATLAVLRDVTDIKLAEMEIVRLNRELEQRLIDLENANDELETFNATVSHDLRTPLMVIRGFSDRIAEKGEKGLDGKVLDQLGMIRSSAAKMEQLIDDLLAYSRLGKQALRPAPVRMDELVGSAIRELRVLYPDGDVKVSPLADCVGDERMLRQAFGNLLANAFKFSGHRSRRVIEIGCFERPGENVYFVKDNGAGFDTHDNERLFKAFQRLHSQEEFKGTGMGLAIVKKIVGLHGGTVWAQGEPDRGATFFVALPKRS